MGMTNNASWAIGIILAIGTSIFMGSYIVIYQHLAFGILFVFMIALFIFIKPEYFILFWLIFACISNKIVFSGVTSYGLMILIYFPCLLLKIFINYRKEAMKFPILKYYAIFLLTYFVSIWYSPEAYLIGVRKYLNFVIPLLFSLLMFATIKEPTIIKKYFKIMLLASGIVGILGTVMFLGGKWQLVTDAGVSRAAGAFGHPNDYAMFLNINIGLSLMMFIYSKLKADKILYSLLLCILLISIVFTYTRGAYLSLGLMLIIVVLHGLVVRKKYSQTIAITCCIGTLFFVVFQASSEEVSSRFHDIGSFDLRLIIWKSVIDQFIAHPIIGNGFRSSLVMVSTLTPYRDLTSTHNLYLQILLETGIIGLISFLIGYLSMLFYAIKIYLNAQWHYTKGVSMGFIIIFIAMLFNSFTENSFYTPMINLYIWFSFTFAICFFQAEKRAGSSSD